MLIQGPITAITPPDYTNNFGVQYQNITVQTVQGPMEGRIGTKKPYTAQDLNQQGQWDCETASNNQGTYNKFKKHYDKPYQDRQNTQQAPSQPAQATNYQNPAPRDYDAENRGKVRTQFIKAAIISGDLRCRSYGDVLTLTEFAMTGIDPNNPQQVNANPDYVGDNPQPIGDEEIPF